MQTKDHRLLGCYILNKFYSDLDCISRKLFLLGCVEPDWNVVTYVRGSLKYQFMRGHNALNAKKHFKHLLLKLRKTGVNTPAGWFRLGAALHYLADSFTFAHNSFFSGNLSEHRLYEQYLHHVFTKYLSKEHTECLTIDEKCHERYINDSRSYLTDCKYIVGTALALCREFNMRTSANIGSVPDEKSYLYGKI